MGKKKAKQKKGPEQTASLILAYAHWSEPLQSFWKFSGISPGSPLARGHSLGQLQLPEGVAPVFISGYCF